MPRIIAEYRPRIRRGLSLRKALAHLKQRILAFASTPLSRPENLLKRGRVTHLSGGIKWTFVGAVHASNPHAIRWTADSTRMRPNRSVGRAREKTSLLMAKYFIFERLESGRLLWMGEALDL